MSPLYQSGDFLLVYKLNPIRLKIADKIIFQHPKYGLMVKEILTLALNNERVLVRGSHAASLSTFQIGPIRFEQILGKVIFHVKATT